MQRQELAQPAPDAEPLHGGENQAAGKHATHRTPAVQDQRMASDGHLRVRRDSGLLPPQRRRARVHRISLGIGTEHGVGHAEHQHGLSQDVGRGGPENLVEQPTHFRHRRPPQGQVAGREAGQSGLHDRGRIPSGSARGSEHHQLRPRGPREGGDVEQRLQCHLLIRSALTRVAMDVDELFGRHADRKADATHDHGIDGGVEAGDEEERFGFVCA